MFLGDPPAVEEAMNALFAVGIVIGGAVIMLASSSHKSIKSAKKPVQAKIKVLIIAVVIAVPLMIALGFVYYYGK